MIIIVGMKFNFCCLLHYCCYCFGSCQNYMFIPYTHTHTHTQKSNCFDSTNFRAFRNKHQDLSIRHNTTQHSSPENHVPFWLFKCIGGNTLLLACCMYIHPCVCIYVYINVFLFVCCC